MGYNSKYTGAQVDAQLDKVDVVDGKVTELEQEEEMNQKQIAVINTNLLGNQNVKIKITPKKGFNENGYVNNNEYCLSVFPSGVFRFTAFDNWGYQYKIVEYLSDNSGMERFSWRNTSISEFSSKIPFVVTFRRSDLNVITEDDYANIISNFEIIALKQGLLLSEIRNKVTEIDSRVTKIEQPDFTSYAPINEVVSELYLKNGVGTEYIYNLKWNDTSKTVTIKNSEGITICYGENLIKNEKNIIVVPSYNESGITAYIVLKSEANIGGAKGYVNENSLNIIKSPTINLWLNNNLEQSVSVLEKFVFKEYPKNVFCSSISSEVLVEMYFPNITSDWKLKELTINNDRLKFALIDADGVIHHVTEGSSTYSLKGNHSDKIFTWVNEKTCEVVGYYILHYTGNNYSKSSADGYSLNIDNITDIEKSPRIKDYLSRKGNLVLLGDSLFGKGEYNILAAMLRDITDLKVYNAGFGGCMMSWRTTDGSSDYDALSFVGVADSIAEQNFDHVVLAALSKGTSSNPYQRRAAELKSVDWSQPTTILVDYGNNDYSNGTIIGKEWEYTDAINSYNKETLLGAMNYGLHKIIEVYPTHRIIFMTPSWRYVEEEGVMIPPYAHTNKNGDSKEIFAEHMTKNCRKMGVSIFDYLHFGGRNAFNMNNNQITLDATHYNIDGFILLSKMIKRVYNGWMM